MSVVMLGAIGRLAAVALREVRVAASVVASSIVGARGGAERRDDEVTLMLPAGEGATHLVVLVHGFGASQACWSALARALRDRGATVAMLNYSSFGASVEQLADRLAGTVEQLIDQSAAQRVHLVGHSLGGLIVALAFTDGRLSTRVDEVVTIGSPFGGSPWASLLPIGLIPRALRPGSPLLCRLASVPTPEGVRWLSFSSSFDLIVPASRATPPHGYGEHVTITEAGHAGMLLAPQVISRIVTGITESHGITESCSSVRYE